jgi:hypothetical protein
MDLPCFRLAGGLGGGGKYLWLLPLAMLFEILVFVLPMKSVHEIMKSRK